MALVVVTSLGTACVPEGAPVTRLDISTQLTWCGGVQPPPGEPACHTSPRSIPFEIRQKRDVVAQGTSDTTGHLVIVVPAGVPLRVVAAEAPAYEQCDEPTVVATAGTTTAVVQTCTVFAP